MYLIHQAQNEVERLRKRTFSELGYRERDHLQEWIAKDPTVLGEELLIIQKEFAGFSETNERLDLLALDKQGNLVIIENKLDDSGRDVTWQALKYASYCSSLSKENVRAIFQDYLSKYSGAETAEEKLLDFFGDSDFEELQINKGLSQRIILIAANFRREVTSTVLWLLNYRLRIQCFKVTPYTLGDQTLLSFEQVIPMPDAEDYIIKMAEKSRDDIEAQETNLRHAIRIEFWQQLLEKMNTTTDTELFRNISPQKSSWISARSGVRGVGLNFVVGRAYGRAEIYIDRGELSENESIFDQLYSKKEALERDFGEALTWERLDGKRACRIKREMSANIYDRTQWSGMMSFMSNQMIRLEQVFKKPLRDIASKL